MDGWRLGYATASGGSARRHADGDGNDVTHVNTFVQHGALAAITGDPSALEQMWADERSSGIFWSSAEPHARRDLRALRGSIYAFPDIRGTGIDSQTLANRLLEEAKIVVESGAFYGAAGEGHLRICFGRKRCPSSAKRCVGWTFL